MCKAIEEILKQSGRDRVLRVTCDHVINAIESFEVDLETAINALKVPMEDQKTIKEMVLGRMAEQQFRG